MAKTPSLRKEWDLSFSPSLAQHIGVEAAIVLQRIQFLLTLVGGKVIKDQKHVWGTFAEFQQEHFPFWSVRTVQRVFKSLEDAHVLEFEQPDGYMSRKKYYRINEGAYQILCLESAPDCSTKEDAIPPICRDPSCQFGGIEAANLAASITERSSERSTVDGIAGQKKKSIPSKPNSGLDLKMPHSGERFRTIWDEWVAYRKRRRLSVDPSTLNRHLKKLGKLDESTACYWIETALEKGWQSLFEPRENNQPNGTVIHMPIKLPC